jgi:hypothetical protein
MNERNAFKFKYIVSPRYFVMTDCFWIYGSVVVKALYYKPEGRGFDIQLDFFVVFNLSNPSGRTRP